MADARVISETCSFDDLNEIVLPDIDSSLVMSLLEDSRVVEGADDEWLRGVIQSLEAEILNQDWFLETKSEEYYQFSDCLTTSHDDRIHFEGFDEEMMPCVIRDFADEIENGVEFVGAEDYVEICCGMAMEEDDYNGLWQ